MRGTFTEIIMGLLTVVVLLLLSSVVITEEEEEEAYAQQQQQQQEVGEERGDLSNIFGGGDVVTFDELSQEDLKPVLDYVIRDILNNSMSVYLYLYPDGTLSLSDLRGTDTFYDDVRIQAYHNFTAENGYIFRDGTIFLPDNRTELFAD